MSGMPTPIFSFGIGVMSAMENVCFGVSVWNALVALVVFPPPLAVAVTVYRVAGWRVRLDFHCRCAASKVPVIRVAPPWTATSPSRPVEAVTTIGRSGRLPDAPFAGVMETFAACSWPPTRPHPAVTRTTATPVIMPLSTTETLISSGFARNRMRLK